MINRINLIGRLVADPEIRYTQSGLAVANFRIAVDRNYKNSAGERDTDFIRCVAWRKAAELINQYSGKGHMIAIEGALRMNKYQTKEGENRTSYDVEVENFQFLDRGSQSGGQAQNNEAPPHPSDDNAPPPPSSGGGFESGDDDLPF